VIGVARWRRRGFTRPGFAVVAEGAFAVEDGFLVGAIVLLAGRVAPMTTISGMKVAL